MSRYSSRHFSDHINIQRQYFPLAIKIKGQRPIRAILDAQFAPDAFLTVVNKHSLSYFIRLKLAYFYAITAEISFTFIKHYRVARGDRLAEISVRFFGRFCSLQ